MQVMQFGAGHEPRVTDTEGKIVFENLSPGIHSFRMAEGRGPGAFRSLIMMLKQRRCPVGAVT